MYPSFPHSEAFRRTLSLAHFYFKDNVLCVEFLHGHNKGDVDAVMQFFCEDVDLTLPLFRVLYYLLRIDTIRLWYRGQEKAIILPIRPQ